MKDLEEVAEGEDLTMEEAPVEEPEGKEQPEEEDVCPQTAETEQKKNEDGAEETTEEPSETMDDYQEELEASYKRFSVGDLVTGKVVSVEETGLVLDFSYYAPGTIAAEEMSDDPNFHILEDVHVGDTVTASVKKLDDGAGNLVLSKKSADRVLAWDKLKKMMEEQTVITGTIKDVVPAGAILYVEGIRGFIPVSRLSLNYVRDTKEYLGKTVRVRVIEVEEKGRKLILSAKELLAEEAAEEKNAKIASLKVGSVMEGTVEKLTNYGAFVGLGDGISGLLHVSEISTKRIKEPKDVLSVGQKVNVKIIKAENGKISLSMKALEDEKPQKPQAESFHYKSDGEASTSLASLLKDIQIK